MRCNAAGRTATWFIQQDPRECQAFRGHLRRDQPEDGGRFRSTAEIIGRNRQHFPLVVDDKVWQRNGALNIRPDYLTGLGQWKGWKRRACMSTGRREPGR